MVVVEGGLQLADQKFGELRSQWRTVAGCMIAAAVGTVGLHSYTNGVFVPVLVEEAGFTRSQLAFGHFLFAATIAVLAPFAGAFMDRYGALPIIAVFFVGEAIGFAAISMIPPVFVYYAGSQFLLAALGVGTTPPGFSRIIAARFNRSRGLALGLAICGLGLMAILGPIVANWSLQNFGWRQSYLAVSVFVLVVGGLGLLLIASDRAPAAARAAPSLVKAKGWSGLKHPFYWLMLVGFLLPSIFSGGYLFHMVSIIRDRGFTPEQAAMVQSLIGVAVFAGRLGSGAALDRFSAASVAAVTFAISALGCLLLMSHDPVLICLAALAIGVTIGSELDIMAYTISRAFGVENFGRLYGVAYGALVISGGLSPMLVSFVESSHGYDTAFVISAAGTLLGAVVIFFVLRNQSERIRISDKPQPAEASK
jgi:MFS family permease